MLIRTFKGMAALVIIGAMTLSQVAEAGPPQRRSYARNLRPTQQNSAKDAPKPTAKPTVWLKYINEDIKAPPIRPKRNRYPQRLRFGSSNSPAAKDAPKPTDKPTVWLKYINEDIKAPKPRPKPGQAGNRYPQRLRFGTSNAPAAKDAPKPTDKPTVWLKYINEDIKAPKPRPKPGQAGSRYPQRLRFGTSNAPTKQIPTNRYDFYYRRPGSDFGAPPPRAQKPTPPTFPRDVKVPYTHPPRDFTSRRRSR